MDLHVSLGIYGIITMKDFLGKNRGLEEKRAAVRLYVSFDQHALPSLELHKYDALCPI